METNIKINNLGPESALTSVKYTGCMYLISWFLKFVPIKIYSDPIQSLQFDKKNGIEH